MGLEPVSKQTGFRATGETSLWELSEALGAHCGQWARSPFKHISKSRPLIVLVNMASFTCMSYWGWWHLGYIVTTHNYPNIFGCIPSIIFMHTFELLISYYRYNSWSYWFWHFSGICFSIMKPRPTPSQPMCEIEAFITWLCTKSLWEMPWEGRGRDMPTMGGRAQLPLLKTRFARYNGAQLKLNFRYRTNNDLV